MSESQRRRLYVAAKHLLRATGQDQNEDTLESALHELHCEIELALQASPKTARNTKDLEAAFV